LIDEYRRLGGYGALQAALKDTPEMVLRSVEASGLRGRGGAAFPTGRKWRAVAQQRTGLKYVVANADEGDPGAYIDRFILEDDPHCLIEAMAIAAFAVGAPKGYVYLRCEYPRAETALGQAIEEARAGGFLGGHILGSEFSFDIQLHVGRGSYLCGEETALLNSLAGERPVAMARPPFPTEKGLLGRPTVINNVETLASIPWIVREGGGAYHAFGFSQSRGTKVLSLNSLFNRPGLYEVEFGISLRRIVEELGGGIRGGTLRGLIVGGPLAGIVPPHLLDTPLGFEELRPLPASVGHGGVIAFDEHTPIPQLVRHVFAFGAFESCGKCFPCRLATRRIEQILGGALRGHPAASAREWSELVAVLKSASLCGFGTGLAEFAESVTLHYGAELASCFT
jgi:formate dehydrogenase iron-sulfur subunit